MADDPRPTWETRESTYQTDEQLEMECALLAAESSRDPRATFHILWLLSLRLVNEAGAHAFPHRPQGGSARRPDRHAEPLAIGVVLCEGTVMGSPYRCVLRTHLALGEAVGAEPDLIALLAESYGDLDHSYSRRWRETVTCDRDTAERVAARLARAGMLRLLEREMADFVGDVDKGDGDWNWGATTKMEEPFWESVDKRFHPPTMLARVRELREQAERAATVAEVIES